MSSLFFFIATAVCVNLAGLLEGWAEIGFAVSGAILATAALVSVRRGS